MINAANSPAPGDHDADRYHKTLVAKSAKGKFGTGNPKSHLDWIMINAKKSPAPGDHDADRYYQ